ncbi:rhomboid family intramembrane serine protease [Melissococcus plutonius]|uniref:GlpG protein, membrane protein of glp regulon n=1 Tax=Melissococcus plutonius (strain ATCC 35311 / DSM 29964 / CIP 104052 / LMG 20360 / NCIMB 702443) TaxID=940190 RepID=F3Y991_MELPT|nr:rhomboid family intramembrane serine protease [Melissococcus plutonius]AIM24643.1 rhomboid protease GluP [Melissococcus plutonius S1]KMT24740.1 rhomboid protease GluP [Melissococcus plutonius]KMT26377.1 rhomboid protease GluP [Melissococcus plutonius]KMT27627.1 rhomboid protease GluP [Melissococcus plutonius]KMT29399.1 rhomboid protease GluP [Melissococcus plutonius]
MNNQKKIQSLLKQPFITYCLIGITVIIFLAMEFSGGSENSRVLIQFGALVRPYILINKEYWRLFTPIFLHIGWMHLILNMVTLYYIGEQIERIYGHWRYLGIYLLSGIAGNVLSFSFGSLNSISAGASTALFGLFGAFVILGKHFKNNPAILEMVRQYTIFIMINLIFNLFSSSVDIMGHIGGLFGGLLLSVAFSLPKQNETFSLRERLAAAIAFLFLLCICFAFGLKRYGVFF